ncbi:hypothetical protein BU26DRAFT_565150 [Trematosphaeria pertusa]|uniref:Uncharacterized protein n=1 Tax=Trematosphaeria pertusa TaxID=390896 RepID=A0A6A6IG04_9PLEO|nr:uncharacterized protein BU26DRAFT_565150 [Trematosphaeria pertusa]KAF2249505.1 hypothetical protein BU26DRAFT_565150 [Trematosphaeria pertusa]
MSSSSSLPLSRSRTNWAVALPDEILLEILCHAFTLPKGLDAVRWPVIKRRLVDPPLLVEGIRHLVPEALYKSNSVTIRFATAERSGALVKDGDACRIEYPRPAFHHWVRKLEIHFNLTNHSYVPKPGHPWPSPRDFQVRWMKRLASGAVGFEGLRSLTLVFNDVYEKKRPDLWGDLESLYQKFQKAGPIALGVDTVEITVERHSCKREVCSMDGRLQQDWRTPCYWVAVLEQYFIHGAVVHTPY